MSKIKHFVFLSLMALTVIAIVKLKGAWDDQNMEIRRLQTELAHAQIPLKRDTIRDSIPVARQKVVTVDRTDYKKQLADRQLIKDLQLRIADLESENQQLLETAGQVTLQPAGTNSVLEYHDRWADFTYAVDSQKLDYQVRDSIAAFIERVPKHKFLWFRWGTKGYNVNYVNFNPNSTIKSARYISIE